jgi:hypothetical protein
MYTTDTNTEIVNFLSRAQSHIGAVAKSVAKHVSKRRPVDSYINEMKQAYQLDCFIEALDNNYNDWTEKEIVRYIHFWDSKCKLRQYPYVQRGRFNVNINFD